MGEEGNRQTKHSQRNYTVPKDGDSVWIESGEHLLIKPVSLLWLVTVMAKVKKSDEYPWNKC